MFSLSFSVAQLCVKVEVCTWLAPARQGLYVLPMVRAWKSWKPVAPGSIFMSIIKKIHSDLDQVVL